MSDDKRTDGVDKVQGGGGESGGGRWPGKNDAPADNDQTTHNVTENKPARDKD